MAGTIDKASENIIDSEDDTDPQEKAEAKVPSDESVLDRLLDHPVLSREEEQQMFKELIELRRRLWGLFLVQVRPRLSVTLDSIFGNARNSNRRIATCLEKFSRCRRGFGSEWSNFYLWLNGFLNSPGEFLKNKRSFSAKTITRLKSLVRDIQDSESRLVSSYQRYLHGFNHEKYRGPRYFGIELTLLQRANLGLIEALRRFDPNRHIRFFNYAEFWVRKEVEEDIQVELSTIAIPLPRGIFLDCCKLADYLRKHGREPKDLDDDGIQQMAHACGMSLKKARDRLAILRPRQIYSLDHPDPRNRYNSDGYGGQSLVDCLADPSSQDPHTVVSEFQRRRFLRSKMNELWTILSPTQAFILQMRYDFWQDWNLISKTMRRLNFNKVQLKKCRDAIDKARRSISTEGVFDIIMQEIGDILGLSRERVRQIQERAGERAGRILSRSFDDAGIRPEDLLSDEDQS